MEFNPTFVPIVLIVVTVLVSLAGFNNRSFFLRYQFNVYAVIERKQWWRMITSAFLHADFVHLLFNMFTLYFFSNQILMFLGVGRYLLIYFLSVIGGSLLMLLIYRRHPGYSAIGASAGVIGMLFASVAMNPHIGIYFFFIPIPIPGWLFALVFLAYSIFGMRSQNTSVAHAGHLGGAVLGLLLAIYFYPQTITENGLYILIMLLPVIVLVYFVAKNLKK